MSAGVVGGVAYTLYQSQQAPVQSAALKNPFALTHRESSTAANHPLAAISVLQPDGGSGVSGTVQFRQDAPGSPTRITATIHGLKDGLHGFHIHQVSALQAIERHTTTTWQHAADATSGRRLTRAHPFVCAGEQFGNLTRGCVTAGPQ